MLGIRGRHLRHIHLTYCSFERHASDILAETSSTGSSRARMSPTWHQSPVRAITSIPFRRRAELA